MPGIGGTKADLVICTLSLVGGLGIVIGFAFSSKRKFRQKLVLGLGVVDVCQATVLLIGSAFTLARGGIDVKSPGCDVSAFFYQTCVVVNAAWTLAIGLVTYVSLAHSLSRLAAATEYRYAVWVLWVVSWGIGIIPAAFGTAFIPLEAYGGLCWYQSNTLGYKLMIFVPRAFTLLVVILLYIRLFIFFRFRDVGLLDTSGIPTLSDIDHDPPTPKGKRSSIGWRPLAAHLGVRTPPVEEEYRLPYTSDSDFNQRIGPHYDPNQAAVISLRPPSKVIEMDAPDSPDLAASPRQPATRMSLADHRAFSNRCRADPLEEEPVRQRLSARAINHRTSLLMLLYPLAYLLLFSVSVGRFAIELATNKPVHPALTSVARWLVYSQGAVDGCLFALIEWLFRRFNRC